MQQGLPGFDVEEVHNLFFALQPEEATRTQIGAAVAKLREAHVSAGRWLREARYHLTLHYLGSFSRVPDELAARACAAAARVREAPFDLRLDRFGSFGNRAIPVWLGPSQTLPGLSALHAALIAALAREGVRATHATSFVPHVTVLREATRPLEAPCEPAVDWRVDGFVLIDSCIVPPKPFRVLGRWPLAAQGAGTRDEFA